MCVYIYIYIYIHMCVYIGDVLRREPGGRRPHAARVRRRGAHILYRTITYYTNIKYTIVFIYIYICILWYNISFYTRLQQCIIHYSIA